MIVSASRRTDIPAYYADWLVGRVAAGYCLVANPFDARRLRRVSLEPEDVDFLVLWTRDPRPLFERGRSGALSRLRELEARGLRFYVQMTLAGYPRAIEPGAPELGEAIAAMRELVDALGGSRVVWRYDPIFVARPAGSGGSAALELDADWHRRNFERIAAALAPAAARGPERVTLSLLDEYARTARSLERSGYEGAVFGSPRGEGADDRGAAGPSAAARTTNVAQRELFGTEADRGRAPARPRLPPEPYPELLADLAAIARARGMRPVSCAEPYDLSELGIERGACVDAGLAASIWGGAANSGRPGRRDSGQRAACLCAPSVDIGSYGSCPRGCAYCYATRGRGRLLERGPEDERL